MFDRATLPLNAHQSSLNFGSNTSLNFRYFSQNDVFIALARKNFPLKFHLWQSPEDQEGDEASHLKQKIPKDG